MDSIFTFIVNFSLLVTIILTPTDSNGFDLVKNMREVNAAYKHMKNRGFSMALRGISFKNSMTDTSNFANGNKYDERMNDEISDKKTNASDKNRNTEIDHKRCVQERPDSQNCVGQPGRLFWTYDLNIQACRQFLYYGCGSEKSNRFYTLFDCEMTCIRKKIGKNFDQIEERRATEYLSEYSEVLDQAGNIEANAEFNYLVNINDGTLAAKVQAEAIATSMNLDIKVFSRYFNLTKLSEEKAHYIQKIIKNLLKKQPKKDRKIEKEKSRLYSKLLALWGSTEICLPGAPNKCFGFQGIEARMSAERDYDKLLFLWKEWQDAIGTVARKPWLEALQLLKNDAKKNGFKSPAEFFNQQDFGISNIDDDATLQYKKLLPLYKQIHAFTRARLRERYGDEHVSSYGPIPAHLLGDPMAQQWHTIFNDILIPFPEVPTLDTSILKNNNITVMRMVELADEFYQSIGMDPMTKEFYQRSMFKQPKNREVVCYAEALDMMDACRCDFRVKTCMYPSVNDFSVIHHEMGHVQYYMNYNRVPQPNMFKTGANAAFHEAVGDTMTLSVLTDSHLKNIGLLPKDSIQNKHIFFKSTINYLMQKALYRTVVKPWAYTLEKWRYGVFRDKILPHEYNKKWWDYRIKYQGIGPPVPRNESTLDPLAKFHIIDFTPYLRYFYSFILQFQWHETLCKLAGQHHKFQNCDIYGSVKAGKPFRTLLEKGSSQKWQKINEDFSGISEMSVDAELRYFAPLYKWLKHVNRDEYIGWDY